MSAGSSASAIAVLAAMGIGDVTVIRRPRVAVVSTGDELLEPGQPAAPGKIYDSNSYTIVSAVRSAGGRPLGFGIAGDDLKSLEDKLEQAADVDMLITTAGVSKGDYDMVKDVLASRGKVEFYRHSASNLAPQPSTWVIGLLKVPDIRDFGAPAPAGLDLVSFMFSKVPINRVH